MVGYRHFDKHHIEPLFPFGHGLSYTTFTYSALQLDATQLSSEAILTLSFTIENTGEREGAEVAQLYVVDEQPGDDRPPQSLKGFVKVWLQPGESRHVTLTVPMSDLTIFCPQHNEWRAKPGTYTARVGSSSRDIRLAGSFELVEEAKIGTSAGLMA
ncbi:MAG: fibronectin type III-like domain-contianing protein [Halioglobus sp.]